MRYDISIHQWFRVQVSTRSRIWLSGWMDCLHSRFSWSIQTSPSRNRRMRFFPLRLTVSRSAAVYRIYASSVYLCCQCLCCVCIRWYASLNGHPNYKVVLATNAAESSITLPDVDVVVCCGTHKAMQYSVGNHRAQVRCTMDSLI